MRDRKLGILHCFRLDRNVDLSARVMSQHGHELARLHSLCCSGLQHHHMAVAKQSDKPKSF